MSKRKAPERLEDLDETPQRNRRPLPRAPTPPPRASPPRAPTPPRVLTPPPRALTPPAREPTPPLLRLPTPPPREPLPPAADVGRQWLAPNLQLDIDQGPRTPTEEMEKTTKKAQESPDYCGPLPQDLALSQQKDLTENDDADTKAKSIIIKAWVTLVKYMQSMPIFDHATELFQMQKIRDMKEIINSSDRNRSLCRNIWKKGRLGYEKLKEWLRRTNQDVLAEILQLIEEDKPYDKLRTELKQKAKEKNIGNQKYNEDYSQLKTKLRKELIDFYRSKHSSFHLSPILDNEEDTPLLEFYVMPEISVITFERAFGGGREEKTQIPDLRGIFYKDNVLFSEVYLTADAGLGKTSFCKRLALTWCHAKESNTEHAKDPNSGCAKDLTHEHAKLAISKETKYLREEEIKTMAEFDFLFLVFLRDSFEDCHIIDMVLNQIVTELELENISRQDVQNILSNEKCLVILDGLDEWSHPKNSCKKPDKVIPHRKANQCTILTTTRPWKLSDIKTSQIKQKLVISGLPEESANSLKERVISYLCAGKEERKRVEEFNSSVKEKKVSNLEKIPIMLMFFLCLFCENRQLGRSLCVLYSNITDMLFCRTVKIHTEIPQLSKISQSEIPKCFQENEFCKQFYTLLTVLGKLAFHTLLVETRQENTLVFDRSVVDQFLNEVSLNFCLRTGILTQSKVSGKLLKQETKVSFAHKTVQEFFAALHSTTDPVQFQEIVLSKCKCVQDILKMSKVLIFVSGINEKLSSLILSKVINIVNNDKITQEYRNTLDDSSSLCHQQLKEFQDLCVSCSREFSWELPHNFSLHDVFINESCQEEQYRENLKTLMTRNTQDIRSLLIDMSDMFKTPYTTTQKVIDYFLLRDLVNIENIRYKGEYYDILPLLNSSVKCLSLVCYSSWSQLLFEKVNSLQKLEAIHMSMLKISHSELNLLLDYISQRDCMKEIRLLCLYCTDHRMRSCTGFSLDLSRNSTLRKLTLDSVPLTQVIVNMSSLEHCWLQHLRNPDFALKFLNYEDCKLRTFYCKEIKSTVAIDAVLDLLSLLHHVTEVRLWSIDLGRRSLTFFSRVSIASLLLWWVKIDASTFRELVDFVHKLSQTVIVSMYACTISPEDECESVKEKIKTLQRDFRILRDEKYKFVFETIKD